MKARWSSTIPSVLRRLLPLPCPGRWGRCLLRNLCRNIAPLPLTLGKASISIILLSLVLTARGWQSPRPEDLRALAVSGLIGIGIGDALFFAALRELKAHVLVALMMASPVLTIGLAMIFLGDRPTAAAWAGIVLCLAGVWLVMRPDRAEESATPGHRKGVILGLASVLCMAVSTVVAAKALRTTPALDATGIRMSAGALGLLLCAVFTGQVRAWATQFRHFEVTGRPPLATTVVTFGGFWLSLVGDICYTSVLIANTLNSLEPLFILPLAAVFLKERPQPHAVAGAAIATAGVAVLSFS